MWGCDQIACDDKQCKTDLEHVLPCVHEVCFVACPMTFSLFSVSASFVMVLSLSHPPERGGPLPPSSASGGEGQCLASSRDNGGAAGFSAPPRGSAAWQAGDTCTFGWWRRAKGCHCLLMLQPQCRDGFGHFIMGIAWPLVTSEGQ